MFNGIRSSFLKYDTKKTRVVQTEHQRAQILVRDFGMTDRYQQKQVDRDPRGCLYLRLLSKFKVRNRRRPTK